MNPSLVYFMLAMIASSIGILLVMLLKVGLKKHISTRLQYSLDFIFFILLAIPIIPRSLFARLFSSLNLRNWFNNLYFEIEATANSAMPTAGDAGFPYGVDWFQNYAVSVDRPAQINFTLIILATWIVGVILFTVVMQLCNRKVRLIKESVKPIKDAEILSLFSDCKAEIGVTSNILLGSSVLAKAPMTMGLFKTFIILPARKLSLNDIRYAMLHELAHCKSKDILINTIMCLFQILYWFNPLVHLAFRQTRIDRELACDALLLKMLPRESHIDYGRTLLNFASSLSRPTMFSMAAGIGGSKPQIVKRVMYIASYAVESRFSKVKNFCIFTLIGFLVFCQITAVSTLASTRDSDRFHFTANNVLYADLSHFFGDFKGSFVLYEMDTGLYTIHNRDMSTTRVSPNSTYKIFSALIALETGILDMSSTEREWNGTLQPFTAWNQNQNLTSAMHYSVNWYFNDLDSQVGIENLHSYLSQLSYGNGNLTGGISDFWMESSLRISPVEQVSLLRDLYRNDTIFYAGHVESLKDVLRLSERDGAILSGKTGTGILNGNFANGWFVGYVETDGRTFIFATYIQGEDNAGGSTASQITISILEDMGIF